MTCSDDTLRPLIAQSWHRVAMTGLFPQASVDSVAIDEVNRRGRLATAAAPVLDQMAAELEGTPFAVILADRNCRLVDMRFGKRALEPQLERVGAVPGRLFKEETTGTNSIATSFELRRGIAVRGEEHYIESLKAFSCYGHPVFEPATRRLAGVIDITCLCDDDNPLLEPFITRAAAAIEDRLFGQARAAEQRAFRTFQETSTAAKALPVVVIGDDILLANTSAARIFEVADHAAFRALAIELPAERELVRSITLSNGLTLPVRLRRIPDSGAALFEFGDPDANRQDRTDRRPVGRSSPTNRRPHRALIHGEPGSGRTSKARELALGDAAWIDASELAEGGAAAWLARLGRLLSTKECVVIEAIDLLPATVVRRVVTRLESTANSVICTSGPFRQMGSEHDALFGHFVDRVALTPLREQREEIAALATGMLEKSGDRPQLRFTATVFEALAANDWPGNLTELRAVVEHIRRNRTTGDITLADLPESYRGCLRRRLTPLEQAERDAVIRAMSEAGGNKKVAASLLGISRTTLYRHLHTYGIATESISS